MTNRDRPLRTGFGITPNDLWTLPDLTPNQRCLLGWLHSHADNYLSRLTLNRIGKEYGGGKRAADHIRQLRDAGWLELIEAEPGHPARVVLLSDPWEELLHRSQDVTTTGHETEPPPVTKRDHHRSQNVTTEKNNLEPSDVEHQRETARTPFDAFWNVYPRRQGKSTARQRWAKMTEPERTEAMDALPGWCLYYESVGEQFTPHASTWLNQRRWEDDIPQPTRPEPDRKTASSRAAIARLRSVSDGALDIFSLDSASIREVESET